MKKILENIDKLKEKINSFRPLEGKNLEKFNDYINELYTYESNKIEGNTLTLGETSLIINKGITISGKKLVEHFEVINHIEAIKYIEEIVQNKEDFNEKMLKNLHYLILKSIDTKNAGVYRKSNVMISGTEYVPPKYIEIANLMKDFFEYYNENLGKIHPVILAGEIHERLVTIHPFTDGNGRTARLIMNLILLKNGFPITIIKEREEYYNTLQKAQVEGKKEDFLQFIAKNVEKSLENYLEFFRIEKFI